MNFFMRLLVGLLFLAGAFVGISFLLPSQWEVVRTIHVEAPPAKVYSLIANLKTGWPQWSAFDTAYPDAIYTYSGPEEGLGATRSWKSVSGDGFQKVVYVEKNQEVKFDVAIPKYGQTMHGQIFFDDALPQEDSVRVIWVERGETGNNPISRWMGLFIDATVGPMMEQSLQSLKKLSESA